jgi:type III pantothenate kinase
MSDSALVAVDIGNSGTKLGWSFSSLPAGELPVPRQTSGFATGQLPPAELAAALPSKQLRWRVASVHREGARLLAEWVNVQRPGDEFVLLTYRELPIEVRTISPERVGMDRLAAAVAANAIRAKDRSAIVVDAGSAVTVDLVSADGAFEGGAILPGFRMSAEALFGADQLPLTLLAPNDQPPAALGKDTGSAIRSGLFWGAVGAVREIVERLRGELAAPPDVFVTGGDLRQLAAYLDGASYVPNMVLSGIALSAGRGLLRP